MKRWREALVASALLTIAAAPRLALAQRGAGSEQRALQQAESLFADAVQARAAGDRGQAERLFRDAGGEYRAVLSIVPNNVLALGRLGAVSYQLAEYKEGVDLLRPVVQAQGEAADGELVFQLALNLTGAGDHKSALPYLERVAKQRPDSAEVRAVLARTHSALGQPRRALERAEEYLRVRPKELEAQDTPILRLAAQSAFQAGQHRRAIDPLERLARGAGEDKGPNVRMLRNLAVAYAAAGRSSDAVAVMARLPAAEAEAPETLDARAWVELKQGHAQAALVAGRRLEQLAPSADGKRKATLTYRATVLQAAAYAMLGNREQALARYRRALELSPGDADAHHELGLIYGSGEVQTSLEHFEEAARLAADVERYCLDAGAAARRARQLQRALAHHKRCVELDPGSVPALLELAASELGAAAVDPTQLDAAVETYTRATQAQAPADQKQLATRGLVLALEIRAHDKLRPKTGEPDLGAASRDLEAVLAADRSQLTATRNLAVVRLLQKRPADAVALLRPVLVQGGQAARELSALSARAMVENNELDEAARVLEQHPANDAAHTLEEIYVTLRLGRTDRAAKVAATVAPGSSDNAVSAARAVGLAHLYHAAALLAQGKADSTAGAETELRQIPERSLEKNEQAYYEGASLLTAVRLGRREGLQARVQSFQKRVSPELAQGMLGPGGMQALVAAGHYLARNYGEAADAAQKALAGAKGAGEEAGRALKQLYGYALLAQASRAYGRGGAKAAEKDVKKAGGLLEGSDDLAFAQAVLGYASGKRDAATRVWRRLDGHRIPEVYANLGIAADDSGDRKAAYDLYKRYVAAGGRDSERVRRWIDLKERFFNFREGP